VPACLIHPLSFILSFVRSLFGAFREEKKQQHLEAITGEGWRWQSATNKHDCYYFSDGSFGFAGKQTKHTANCLTFNGIAAAIVGSEM